VDENLCGTTLSPAESALFTQRRKSIYEAIHPETRNGATGNGREKVRQVGEATPPDRFTADTASRTGRSERKVQRDAQRGESVGGEPLRAGRTGSKTIDVGCYCLAAPHARLLRKPDRAVERHWAKVTQLARPLPGGDYPGMFYQSARQGLFPPVYADGGGSIWAYFRRRARTSARSIRRRLRLIWAYFRRRARTSGEVWPKVFHRETPYFRRRARTSGEVPVC
jgi:hypothetical protein